MIWLTALSFAGALGFGFYLGRPRRYEQPLDEIDKRLDEDGEHQKVKRHRTVLNLLQRRLENSSRTRRRREHKPFRMR